MKLKKCPFGHDNQSFAHGYYSADDSTPTHWVVCLLCGTRTPRSGSKESAAEWWNTRPTEDALVEALKPFASMARYFQGKDTDDPYFEADGLGPVMVTYGDIYRAEAAIAAAGVQP